MGLESRRVGLLDVRARRRRGWFVEACGADARSDNGRALTTDSRITGALVGAAVGDALGAPFEFRPPRTFAMAFPSPNLRGSGEMIGGGGFEWAPGEFTDDTQMGVLLAQSLVDARHDLNPDDLWRRWRAWACW